MKKIFLLLLSLLFVSSLAYAGSMTSVTNPAGSNTEVQFNDSGVFGADSSLVWDKTNNRLGIGVTPTGILQMQSSTAGDIGPILKVDNNAGAYYQSYLFDTAQPTGLPAVAFIRCRNTIASPAQTQSGDYLGGVIARGCYTGGVTDDDASGRFVFSASEAHTSSAQGADFKLTLNTNGTTSMAQKLVLTNAGKLGIFTVSSPTAYLHVPAGTATASTGPLKINSGTNLTTPESGVIEYNDTFHFTSAVAKRYTPSGSITATGANDEVGNSAGVGDTNAFSQTITAGLLASTAQKLEFMSAGRFAATASTDKRIRVIFGTTTIFDTGALAITTANSWHSTCHVMRDNSSTTAKASCTFMSSSSVLPVTVTYTAVSEDLALSKTLKLVLNGTNANDVVAEFYATQYQPRNF